MAIITGTSGDDLLSIEKDRSNDTLLGLAGNDTLNGLTGNGGNTLDGGDGDDQIFANRNDTAIGGAGDDLLFGGVGGNTLTGGLGQDLFELLGVPLPKSPNTITDFNALEDTIQIDLPSGSQVSDVKTVQAGSDAIVSLGSNQIAIVKNTLVSALSDIVVLVGNDPVTPTPLPTPAPTPIVGTSLDKNILTTDASFRGFGINPVSQKAGTKVSEIGVFTIDDQTGKVGGIAPGAAGYLKAVTDSARSIFSTLDGTFFNPTKREISLDSNKIYQFFQVQDGSIAELQQQIASGKTPTNIRFALPDGSVNSPIKLTTNSTNDGYKVSVNNDELVLNVAKLDGATPNIPIGAKSQSLAQGRTIDLTDFGTTILKADITTTSSAGYTNNIGFYAVEDAIGTIKTAAGTFKPGDANYAVEAIKSAVLQIGKTDSKLNQDIVGGKIYAPVVVAQGSFSDFVTKNPTNGGDGNAIHAYFNYIGANPDQLDHFRLLGNNTFGVEDVFGGGDRDFNDLVVKATFRA
jgi:Domain of unknown function (DUF4114)/RTX calcium-binding nonapeptide repeat (4 copies)